jgi:hypothetical protein
MTNEVYQLDQLDDRHVLRTSEGSSAGRGSRIKSTYREPARRIHTEAFHQVTELPRVLFRGGPVSSGTTASPCLLVQYLESRIRRETARDQRGASVLHHGDIDESLCITQSHANV